MERHCFQGIQGQLYLYGTSLTSFCGKLKPDICNSGHTLHTPFCSGFHKITSDCQISMVMKEEVVNKINKLIIRAIYYTTRLISSQMI